MNMEKWGRSTARERYGSEGMKKMAEGGAIDNQADKWDMDNPPPKTPRHPIPNTPMPRPDPRKGK